MLFHAKFLPDWCTVSPPKGEKPQNWSTTEIFQAATPASHHHYEISHAILNVWYALPCNIWPWSVHHIALVGRETTNLTKFGIFRYLLSNCKPASAGSIKLFSPVAECSLSPHHTCHSNREGMYHVCIYSVATRVPGNFGGNETQR